MSQIHHFDNQNHRQTDEKITIWWSIDKNLQSKNKKNTYKKYFEFDLSYLKTENSTVLKTTTFIECLLLLDDDEILKTMDIPVPRGLTPRNPRGFKYWNPNPTMWNFSSETLTPVFPNCLLSSWSRVSSFCAVCQWTFSVLKRRRVSQQVLLGKSRNLDPFSHLQEYDEPLWKSFFRLIRSFTFSWKKFLETKSHGERKKCHPKKCV